MWYRRWGHVTSPRPFEGSAVTDFANHSHFSRSYSTTTCRTVSLQNGIGSSPARSVSTSNSSFPRRIFSWAFCRFDHERGECKPAEGRRLQFFENLGGSRASESPLVLLLLHLVVRRHSTTDHGFLIRRQVHDRNLTVLPAAADQARLMLGRCDGWMGLMGSRAAPLLSGCYISLRCGMRVGDEGCLLRRAANAKITFHRTGAM